MLGWHAFRGRFGGGEHIRRESGGNLELAADRGESLRKRIGRIDERLHRRSV
jgi:hypothetical protein